MVWHASRGARRATRHPEDLERLTGSARVVEAVQQGLAQADAGQLLDHHEAMRMLEERFTAPAEQPNGR